MVASLQAFLNRVMKQVNLNDPWLIFKSHVVGFILGMTTIFAGVYVGQDLGGVGEAMGLIIGALFLTLLLPYRIHDQQSESGSLKILGTLPSVILGLAGSIVITGMIPGIGGEIHCVWVVIWLLSDLLFASFWYLGGMSRSYQVGLNSQVDPLPKCIGRICSKLSTGWKTMPRHPSLADKLIQAYNADDFATLAELLKEASQYLQKYYKELGYWDKVQKQHEALFAQALFEAENATTRIIALSRQEFDGESGDRAPKIPRTTLLG